jgi:hypothetical protein
MEKERVAHFLFLQSSQRCVENFLEYDNLEIEDNEDA